MPIDQPLYMQILNYLKEKIDNKQLLPGQQLPTELELATQFGVSRITSKKAFEELEKDGLIYRKRGLGSFVSLSATKAANSGMGKVISIIFPYQGSSGWVMSYINGAMSVFAPKGYYLSIHCTEGSDRVERELLKDIPDSGIGGIIYYPSNTTKNVDILTSMCLNKYPIVTIDKYFEAIPLSSVAADNFRGEYLLTEYLVNQGHKRIAYIAGEDIGEKTSLRDRYLGYCKALRDIGLYVDFDIASTGYLDEIRNPYSEDSKKDYMAKRITYLMNRGVTAIVAENDMEAVFIYKVLSDMKIRVPKDMSIVGFDNIELLNHLDIPLTTVHQNFYDVGKRAAEIIIDMIEAGYEYKKELIPVDLVIRETTDAVASSVEKNQSTAI